MQRRVLFLILLVAVVGSVASWWAFSSLGDWQVRPPRLSGRVWAPTPGPAAHFLFVTHEERQRTVYVTRFTYRTESYDRYALQVRRVGDGGLEQAIALGDFTERQESLAPQILGVVGDVVWLWRDGPEARAVSDLAGEGKGDDEREQDQRLGERQADDHRGLDLRGGLRVGRCCGRKRSVIQGNGVGLR